MKAFNKSLVVIGVLVSGLTSTVATAAIKVSDSNTAVFNIGGTIDAMCKVNSTGHANASSLVLDQNNTTQEIGVLEVWCNTGNNATTKYSSANSGFLVSGDSKIAYTLDVGNFANDVDLSTEYTASNTAAGTDEVGTAESHTLKITPQSTGLDAAGDYSDTITVTVSYN